VATAPRQLRIYVTSAGHCPFSEWLDSLKDRRARYVIKARLDRIELGNFGDCRHVGDGVNELRIDFGPGYRVYFGQEGDVIVLLLCGGAKRTQRSDIAGAKAYWKDYRSRKDA
jgi:putative addiction module killer protein